MTAREDKVQTLGDYAAVLRRRWQYLVTIIPASILLAVFLAYTLPVSYESTATILLEPSSISPELIKTTVVSYADQQIQLVQRTVMTADRLVPVVEKLDPYPNMTELSVREKARQIIIDTSLEKVDPVTLEPLMESSAFSIHYRNPDAELAAEIAGKLADLFLQYNVETRAAKARETYNFLLLKSEETDRQVRELEQKISKFKEQYGDALPETRDRNEGSLDRSQRDLDSLEAQIRMLEQQESMLKLQLAQVNPTLVSAGTDPYTQLAALRAELAAAQQKYTPDHPDVKRLKRAIEALLAESKVGGTNTVIPDNPDYLRISSELDSVRRNLAALRSSAGRTRQQMMDYEKRLSQAPIVERDYVKLLRDREIAQAQFEDIQNKLRGADMAQALESEAKGERYTLIRAPNVESQPASPNRLGIMLLGIVLGGGLAVGLAAFRESSDPTVRSAYDVADVVKLPLIGAIPYLPTRSDRRRQRLVWGSVGVAYVVATVVVAIAVATAV